MKCRAKILPDRKHTDDVSSGSFGMDANPNLINSSYSDFDFYNLKFLCVQNLKTILNLDHSLKIRT